MTRAAFARWMVGGVAGCCVAVCADAGAVGAEDDLSARASIHRLEQERYGALGLETEADWDAHRSRQALARAPAPSAETALAAPRALEKEVFGWHPYWEGSGYTNYQADLLSTIAYFSYEADPNTGYATTMHSWSNTALVAWAHARNIKVVLTVTLFSGHSAFLGSESSKSNMIGELVRLVQVRGADGVNLDFEGMSSSALRAPFTGFVSNLAARMRAAVPGSRVSVDLPSVDWGGVFDVGAFSGFVDQCLLMGYDYYWSTAPYAGPVAPLRGSPTFGVYCVGRSVSNYLAAGLAPGKLLLAVPYYGYEWGAVSSNLHAATTGSGTARLYPSAVGRASTYGRRWDVNSLTPYYMYGSFTQGWYDDTESLGSKYDFANEKGLGGIGIWALGYDDNRTDLWDLLAEKFAVTNDAQAPDLFAFDLLGATRTDSAWGQGISVTGMVQDAFSGLRVDAATPYWFVRNPAGVEVVSSNGFEVVPSDGFVGAAALADVSPPLPPGAVVTGVHTFVAGAADRDGNAAVSNFVFTVVDDDVAPPLISGLGLADAGGAEQYVETHASNSFVASGVPRNWFFDDRCFTSAIPFAFPFYGGNYTQCFVDTNGRITFRPIVSDYTETVGEFLTNAMIAAMWDDLVTTNTYGDIFLDAGPDAFTVRWSGDYRPGAGSGVAHFSVTLERDGDVVMRYGPGNSHGGLVGLSAGDGQRHRIGALSQAGSLEGAPDIVFHAGWLVTNADAVAGVTITGLVQDAGSGIAADAAQAPRLTIFGPDGVCVVSNHTFAVRPAQAGGAQAAAEPLADTLRPDLFVQPGDYTVRVEAIDCDADRLGDALAGQAGLRFRVLAPYAPSAQQALVISEIMRDPAVVSDTYGEWFELYNPGTAAVDIAGWVIKDDASNRHTIDRGGPVLVPALGFFVLGRSTNAAVNGGAPVQYPYSNFALGNAADQVVLMNGTVEVARVSYEVGAVWPNPVGASMELSGPGFNPGVGTNWTAALAAWVGSAGDKGTPGAANHAGTWGPPVGGAPFLALDGGDCTVSNAVDRIDLSGTASSVVGQIVWTNGLTGDAGSVAAGTMWAIASVPLGVGPNVLVVVGTNGAGGAALAQVTVTRSPASSGPQIVISEIMQNPAASSDTYGEWIELCNMDDTAVDINGWVLADSGTDRHVIAAASSLLVPAHGFLVLGRSTNSVQNGGAPVAYRYTGFTLANGADEVVLLCGSTVVARADYDGGLAWPDPDGASMELMDMASDRNKGSNWTTATNVWPGSAGDRGSPGTGPLPGGSPEPGRARITAWDPITDAMTAPGEIRIRLQTEGAPAWVWWTDDLSHWPTDHVRLVIGSEFLETNLPSGCSFFRFSTLQE